MRQALRGGSRQSCISEIGGSGRGILVSQQLWDSFLPRNDHILMQELLAIPLAYVTFSEQLTGLLVTVFVDNDAAKGALINGASRSRPSAGIVGEFWLLACEWSVFPWVERVASEANIADGPSRGEWSEVFALGGSRIRVRGLGRLEGRSGGNS